jgi:hypothetical protein
MRQDADFGGTVEEDGKRRRAERGDDGGGA